jgi:hypothetical protein
MLFGINLLTRTKRAKQIKLIGAKTKRKERLKILPEKRGIEKTVIFNIDMGIIAEKGKKKMLELDGALQKNRTVLLL